MLTNIFYSCIIAIVLLYCWNYLTQIQKNWKIIASFERTYNLCQYESDFSDLYEEVLAFYETKWLSYDQCQRICLLTQKITSKFDEFTNKYYE